MTSSMRKRGRDLLEGPRSAKHRYDRSATGKKTANPQTLPGDGQTHFVCPHVDGAKSWLPGSCNPDAKILYVPLVEACNDLMPLTGGGGPGLLSTAFARSCGLVRNQTASTAGWKPSPW
jgi:hypothetical protein